MRRSLLLAVTVVLAALLAAGCGQFGKRYEGESSNDTALASGEERQVSDERWTEEVRKREGCTDVEEFESEGSTHTTDLDEKVEYKHNPPHSGDHYQIASEWGLYDEQQPDVQTTHNLEHGHIVMHHKGLSAAERDELYDLARINPFHLFVQPREANPKDGVYYMAWTAQVYCEKPSAAALQYMIDNWRDQAPELFTDDAGGGAMGAGPRES